MTRAAPFKQSDVTRAIKGAQAAGFQTGRVDIGTDGRISIYKLRGPAEELAGNAWDGNLELMRRRIRDLPEFVTWNTDRHGKRRARFRKENSDGSCAVHARCRPSATR